MFGKKKKNILCICHFGENRSKHLAEFLEKKGYQTRHKGVAEKGNSVTQEDVDWADKIVIVRELLKDMFLDKFTTDKEIVTLEVIDNPDNIKGMSEFVWDEYQVKKVYPEIERQIKKFLPL